MTLRVRQLQLLHRHGDRSPMRNVFAGGADEQAESALWAARLPSDAALETLRQKFPVVAEPSATENTRVYQRWPFGTLTARGIDDMTRCGRRVRDMCEREGFAIAELQQEDVQVFSSAFTRTQLSAQAMLSGLLEHAPHLQPEVRVLPPEREMIYTYATFSEISDLKKQLEHESKTLAEAEEGMNPARSELERLLPIFSTGEVPFAWMYANDYFVCRRAHDLPVAAGLEELATPTIDHHSYCFHQYYAHPPIQRLVAGRQVHRVVQEMKKVASREGDSKKLVVYSGHDVSIVPVLHALNAAIVDDHTWWPDYSSALTLELLENESGQLFVRVRLDGEVLSFKHSPSPLLALDDFGALVADRVGASPP